MFHDALLFYCCTLSQSGRIAAIARHMSFAQITGNALLQFVYK